MLYNQRITLSPDSSATLKAAAEDAAQTLKKMTGKPFTVETEYSDSGIQLLQSTSPHAAADAKQQLADKGREPFVIRSENDGSLQIIANTDAGLSQGIYFYLQELGARFYFPNERWTIIPQKKDITLRINKLMEPDFKIRDFFGTGGFGPKTAVDPELEMADRWAKWQQRNRFGQEYVLGGHSGEAFNVANKEVLLKHPEYLAKVGGKHVPWSKGAKLNPANRDAVQLFVDWSVERYRKAREQNAGGPASFAVSVDPADGGGHCNSEECKKIGSGSVSDTVFFVANEVARAVRREFPDGWVSLLAYNEHADVPTIPLEPNIHVKLVPYAFQRTGMTPAEFIAAWGKKTPNISLYDYWAITDWARSQPEFNYLKTPGEKLRFWKANNIQGFKGESTYSAGAMGIGWHVASRLMWDLETDEQAVINEFYDDAFGPARAPMQRMLERWARGFLLTEHELGLSYRDLLEARRLAAGNEPVMARLDDYGGYLHFLRLWHEYEQSAGNAPERVEAARRVLDHIWDIYDSAMVHTYRMTRLMTGRWIPGLRDDFDYKNKNAAFWKDVQTPSRADIEKMLAEGAKKYPPLDFARRNYTGQLVPLKNAAAAPPPEDPFDMMFKNGVTFELQAPPGMKSLILPVSAHQEIRLQLSDQDGNKLWEEAVASTEATQRKWQQVEIPFPAPGRYTLKVISQRVPFHVQPPAGLPFAVRQFTNSQGHPAPPLYFYVPRGLKTIALHLEYHLIPRFFDSEVREVQIRPEGIDPKSKAGGIVLVDVPPGQDSKVWSLRDVRAAKPMQMLNVPHLFAYYPDGLLVPADALQE